ncbi:phosphotransferase family protein [Sphingomonas sp. UYAg733]
MQTAIDVGHFADRQRIAEMLHAIDVVDAVIAVEPLPGGVSSDVFRVDLGDRMLCMKFAIPRLRVAREWYAPVARSIAEYRWLAFIGNRFPGYAPRVLGHDPDRHGIAMEFLPRDTHSNWKSDLLSGKIDVGIAASVGRRLGEIHAASARDSECMERFASQADFDALRIDPYLRFTANQHPAIADRIDALAREQGNARIALVHGDISPKNILCGPDGPVFIDAECATFGDPAFDAAFVLNHLAIKAIVYPADGAALLQAAIALWAAYRGAVDWEPIASINARVARLLPALMLTRVDGKSPLEYLTSATAKDVRDVALKLFDQNASGVHATLYSIAGISR